jgi:hypothetical protein
MHLSDHDLRQLDEAALANLTPEQARALLSKAIEDLKRRARAAGTESDQQLAAAEHAGAVGAERSAGACSAGRVYAERRGEAGSGVGVGAEGTAEVVRR